MRTVSFDNREENNDNNDNDVNNYDNYDDDYNNVKMMTIIMMMIHNCFLLINYVQKS